MSVKVNGEIGVGKYKNEITSKILYKKDTNGLTDQNMGKFYKRNKSLKNATVAWRDNVY